MRSARSTRWIAGLSGLALAMGLAACGGDAETSPKAEPTRLVADATTPVLQEGEDHRVSGSILGRLGDRSAGFHGWTEDGTEIYTRSAGRYDVARRPGTADQSKVALMARDPESGTTRVLSQRPESHRPSASKFAQPYGYAQVTPAGDAVVWIEGHDISLGDLRALDLASGRETLLVDAKDAGRGTPPWPRGLVQPVVAGDTVYFVGYRSATVNAERAADGPLALYSVPIDGSDEPTEIVRGVEDVFPAPDGRLDVVLADRAAGVDRMVRWDPAKGQDGEIADTEVTGVEFFANEAGVRMSHPEEGAPIRIDSPDHGRFEIEVGDGSSEYLTASGRWAAFTTSVDGETTAFLLDLERGELRRVEGAKIAANVRPLSPQWYVPRIESEIAPKTYDVIELLPAD